MTENVGHGFERHATIDHRRGGGMAQRVDTAIMNSSAYQQVPHGVAHVVVASLSRKRGPSRLKHADGVWPLVPQVRDERLADIIGERETTILPRLRAPDMYQAIPPINILYGEIGDFLATKTEPQKQQQERAIAHVSGGVRRARAEEIAYLACRQLFRQMNVLAIGDFGQRGIPAAGDEREFVRHVAQEPAKRYQPRPLRLVVRQPCKLLPDEGRATAEVQIVPRDDVVGETTRQESTGNKSLDPSSRCGGTSHMQQVLVVPQHERAD
jgi:hypothetical protein